MARLRPSLSKLCMLAGIGAVVATLGFVHDVTQKSWTKSSLPSAAAQPTTGPTAQQTVSPATPYAGDDRGFINSSARCDTAAGLVAAVRTQNSLVAICVDPSGGYQYRGVRLSDGAHMAVPAVSISGREFVARTESARYEVTTKQLVITAGDQFIRSEPVLEYREPQSFQAESPPR